MMQDVLRRPPGPPMIFVNPFKHPKRFLGIEGCVLPFDLASTTLSPLCLFEHAFLCDLAWWLSDTQALSVGYLASTHIFQMKADTSRSTGTASPDKTSFFMDV